MNTKLAVAAVGLLSFAGPVSAHRLDEYLQATILSVEKGRVQAFMRLAPGVAVFSVVLASIDSDGDGVISETERRAYAERVLRDVSLRLDGSRLAPRLISFDFPRTEEMKEGLGEIQINFRADLPAGGSHRKLIFENHHQSRIAAYLMNCLAPRDRDIRVIAQNRNKNQSWYQLDYVQADSRSAPLFLKRWLGLCELLGAVALLLIYFRHKILPYVNVSL